MLPRILKKVDLTAWVAALMEERQVAAPVLKETSPSDRSEKFGWVYLEDPAEVRLDYDLTVLGPKTFLWPPR